MTQNCCVQGCRHNKRTSTCTFKKFPSDPQRSKVWETLVRRSVGSRPGAPDWKRSPCDRICECHFDNDQFETDRQDNFFKLRWNAVPRLFGSKAKIPSHRLFKREKNLVEAELEDSDAEKIASGKSIEHKPEMASEEVLLNQEDIDEEDGELMEYQDSNFLEETSATEETTSGGVLVAGADQELHNEEIDEIADPSEVSEAARAGISVIASTAEAESYLYTEVQQGVEGSVVQCDVNDVNVGSGAIAIVDNLTEVNVAVVGDGTNVEGGAAIEETLIICENQEQGVLTVNRETESQGFENEMTEEHEENESVTYAESEVTAEREQSSQSELESQEGELTISAEPVHTQEETVAESEVIVQEDALCEDERVGQEEETAPKEIDQEQEIAESELFDQEEEMTGNVVFNEEGAITECHVAAQDEDTSDSQVLVQDDDFTDNVLLVDEDADSDDITHSKEEYGVSNEEPSQEDITGIELPGQEEVPAENEVLAQEEALAENEVLAQEESLAENVLAEDQALMENEALAQEKALAEDEALTENEALAQEEGLVESEALAEEEGLVESEALAQEEGLVESEALAQEEGLVESEALAQEEGLVESEALAQEEGFVESEALAQEEGLVESEPVAQEEANAGSELLAQDEANAESEGFVSQESISEDETIGEDVAAEMGANDEEAGINYIPDGSTIDCPPEEAGGMAGVDEEYEEQSHNDEYTTEDISEVCNSQDADGVDDEGDNEESNQFSASLHPDQDGTGSGHPLPGKETIIEEDEEVHGEEEEEENVTEECDVDANEGYLEDEGEEFVGEEEEFEDGEEMADEVEVEIEDCSDPEMEAEGGVTYIISEGMIVVEENESSEAFQSGDNGASVEEDHIICDDQLGGGQKTTRIVIKMPSSKSSSETEAVISAVQEVVCAEAAGPSEETSPTEVHVLQPPVLEEASESTKMSVVTELTSAINADLVLEGSTMVEQGEAVEDSETEENLDTEPEARSQSGEPDASAETAEVVVDSSENAAGEPSEIDTTITAKSGSENIACQTDVTDAAIPVTAENQVEKVKTKSTSNEAASKEQEASSTEQLKPTNLNESSGESSQSHTSTNSSSVKPTESVSSKISKPEIKSFKAAHEKEHSEITKERRSSDATKHSSKRTHKHKIHNSKTGSDEKTSRSSSKPDVPGKEEPVSKKHTESKETSNEGKSSSGKQTSSSHRTRSNSTSKEKEAGTKDKLSSRKDETPSKKSEDSSSKNSDSSKVALRSSRSRKSTLDHANAAVSSHESVFIKKDKSKIVAETPQRQRQSERVCKATEKAIASGLTSRRSRSNVDSETSSGSEKHPEPATEDQSASQRRSKRKADIPPTSKDETPVSKRRTTRSGDAVSAQVSSEAPETSVQSSRSTRKSKSLKRKGSSSDLPPAKHAHTEETSSKEIVSKEFIANIPKMCRICGSQNENLLNVLGPEGRTMQLSEKVHSILPIKIREEEPLPTGVCHSCVVTLMACEKLIEKCSSIDSVLRVYFKCPVEKLPGEIKECQSETLVMEKTDKSEAKPEKAAKTVTNSPAMPEQPIRTSEALAVQPEEKSAHKSGPEKAATKPGSEKSVSKPGPEKSALQSGLEKSAAKPGTDKSVPISSDPEKAAPKSAHATRASSRVSAKNKQLTETGTKNTESSTKSVSKPNIDEDQLKTGKAVVAESEDSPPVLEAEPPQSHLPASNQEPSAQPPVLVPQPGKHGLEEASAPGEDPSGKRFGNTYHVRMKPTQWDKIERGLEAIHGETSEDNDDEGPSELKLYSKMQTEEFHIVDLDMNVEEVPPEETIVPDKSATNSDMQEFHIEIPSENLVEEIAVQQSSPKSVIDSILVDWSGDEDEVTPVQSRIAGSSERVLLKASAASSKDAVNGSSQLKTPCLFGEDEEADASQVKSLSGSVVVKEESFWPEPGPDSPSVSGSAKPQGDVPWKCFVCGKRGKSLSKFLEHKKLHLNDRKLVSCQKCSESFSNMSLLKAHQKSHHGDDDEDEVVQQPKQTRQRPASARLNRSVVDVDLAPATDGLYHCSSCQSAFASIESLCQHKLIHQKNDDADMFKCTTCKRTFYHYREFQQHIATHQPSPPSVSMFQCAKCNMKMTNQKEFIEHIESHNTDNQNFTCDLCSKVFDTKHKLRSHRSTAHKSTAYACHLCDKVCQKRITLIEHLRKHTGDNPFACPVCNKRFNRLANYKAHMVIHENARRYECHYCGKRFNRQSIQQRHIKTHTSEQSRKHRCRVCNLTFGLATEMFTHRRLHTREEVERATWEDEKQRLALTSFPCKICQSPFNTVEDVLAHMPMHSDDERDIAAKLKNPKLECDICGKVLNSKRTFNSHRSSHIDGKPFVCKICSKGYSTSTGLNYHMLSHTGERPFPCTFCHKGYKNSTDLKVHMRQHTGEFPYKCNECNKAFRSASSLQKHGFVHSEVRAFKCQFCHMSFKRESTKHNHERIHTNDRRYKCKVCSRTFIQKGACDAHEKLHFRGGSQLYMAVGDGTATKQREGILASSSKAEKHDLFEDFEEDEFDEDDDDEDEYIIYEDEDGVDDDGDDEGADKEMEVDTQSSHNEEDPSDLDTITFVDTSKSSNGVDLPATNITPIPVTLSSDAVPSIGDSSVHITIL